MKKKNKNKNKNNIINNEIKHENNELFKITNDYYKLNLKIKTNSKFDKIEKDENEIIVSISELPKNGEANIGIIKLFSKILNIPKNEIIILKGFTSKYKILGITLKSISINALNLFINKL